MEDNWSADKQKEHGTYTKTLGKIAVSESSEYRSMAVSALKIFPEILNTRAVNDFWQDVEKLNRRNKINNSKEKYLDHLEESTYEVLDDTRSYVVADVKAETRKRKSPTRYDRNKSSEGQNQTKRIRFLEKESKKGRRVDELPDGTKIKRPTPLNLVPSDDDEGVPTSVLITASDAESEESDLVVDDEIRSLTQDQIVKRHPEDTNFLDQAIRNEDTSYERCQRCSTPVDKIKTENLDEVPSTTTTSLYVPSSPPTPVDEEYMMQLVEGSTRWVVNDIDITEICREYRAVMVKKCESMEVTLSATEELILSHVFVFQEQSSHGLCEHFDDELWAELFAEFRGLYPYAPIPDKISNLFLNIVKIPCEEPNQTERQKLARRYLRNFEVITEEEEIIVEMFRELVDNEQSSFSRNYVAEDTHAIRNITPIILKPFFRDNKRITFEGANKMSESSAIAKRRFDPERLGTKPDFTVMTTNPQKHVELFVVEIKPNKTNNALVSEDLVSLGKTMKCAIDKSIKDGADDLVICGMQVIGYLGRAYVMDLRFEGIYRMILIGEFELPRGSTSWGTALQCYQVLNIIRVIVNNGATSYQTAIRKNKQSKSSLMIKPMFHSPTKVQKCK
ncbi:hypothetical protein GLOIN_2v1739297 [Rhizophagus clarus]|uniref:Uncharacterized protein n=1 Tax=Rhizophagus clarus TaxID=94130 RepID=A0A8H3QMW3_9GLOM|nr:hypothetical protein GLOIN_2v1739297 [Rhizophagus clarus]